MMFARLLFAKALVVMGFVSCHAPRVLGQPVEGPTAEKTAPAEERFDLLVREDIFAGFNGDAKRLKKGMERCEQKLAEDPEHAEAMVWRGAARVFLSGQKFQQGDTAAGIELWGGGIKDMDQAKRLEPENLAVMIPRAAVMINAGRSAPPIMGRPLLLAVRDDFEQVYQRQKDVLEHIGEHPLGELRMGLADIYRLLKQPEKSTAQLNAVVQELPDSPYASRAKQWLAAPPEARLAHNCIGCHDPSD